MPDYIKDILIRFKHQTPKTPQYSPHEHIPVQYGAKTRQYALKSDTTPLLDKSGIKYVQQVI